VPLELNREVIEVFSTALMQEQVALPVTGMSQGSSFAVVPEPATLMLLSLGVVMLKKNRILRTQIKSSLNLDMNVY